MYSRSVFWWIFWIPETRGLTWGMLISRTSMSVMRSVKVSSWYATVAAIAASGAAVFSRLRSVVR
ncbi:hypothetical protein DSECCO2_529820 [anaerobic digester metagenome]